MTNQNTKREQNKRKHSPCIRLKVPSGLIQSATILSLITPLKYFYAAKSFRSNGQFKRNELVPYLIEETGKCKATVKANIGRLIETGWLKKSGTGYQLASYDKVWNCCGIDTTTEHLKLISINPGSDLVDMVGLKEFTRKQKNQQKEFEIRITCKEFGLSYTEYISQTSARKKKLKCAAMASYNQAKVFEQEKEELRALKKDSTHSDNSLTCLGFAKLIGRKSARTGYRLQQRLKQAGLIKIENRKLNLNYRMPEVYFRSENTHSSFWLFKGMLFKQLPNLITIL